MNLGDLDIDEQSLLTSVIKKINNTNPEKGYIDQLKEIIMQLNPEERQKLPALISKME